MTEIQKQAMDLPAEERALLADQLIESLNNPETLAAWGVESEERLAAYKRRELSARDADEVIDELRDGLSK